MKRIISGFVSSSELPCIPTTSSTTSISQSNSELQQQDSEEEEEELVNFHSNGDFSTPSWGLVSWSVNTTSTSTTANNCATPLSSPVSIASLVHNNLEHQQPKAKRRKEEPTTTKASPSIGDETILKKKYGRGFGLLRSMGWKEGKGLGNQENGRVEPIEFQEPIGRQGIVSGNAERRILQRKIIELEQQQQNYSNFHEERKKVKSERTKEINKMERKRRKLEDRLVTALLKKDLESANALASELKPIGINSIAITDAFLFANGDPSLLPFIRSLPTDSTPT